MVNEKFTKSKFDSCSGLLEVYRSITVVDDKCLEELFLEHLCTIFLAPEDRVPRSQNETKLPISKPLIGVFNIFTQNKISVNSNSYINGRRPVADSLDL